LAPLAPPRLLDEPAEAGALLRAADRAYGRGLDEPAAWTRFAAATLGEAPAPRRPRRTLRLALPLVLAATAAALVLSGRLAPPSAKKQLAPIAATPAAPATARPTIVPMPPPAAQEAGTPEAPPEVATAPVRRVTPSRRPHPLATGATLLADGTSIELAPRAVAAVSTAARANRAVTTVALAAGAIELAVAPQDARHHFLVEGGRFRFQVAGARFRLVRSDARAELEVREGTVAVVSPDDRVVARVGRGERWSGSLLASSDERAISAARAEAGPPPDPGAAREPGPADCMAMARDGLARKAIDCYARVAEGTGLSAQAALFEIAHLRRDVLGDSAGALEALEQYRARFPHGALRAEIEVSLVELLPKLGRYREALAESERLLAMPGGKERAAELRYLRGNIYREGLKDYGDAAAEYAAAARDRGVTGDDAEYLRAVSLEDAGRRADAESAFRAYLQRAHARHASEAQHHLQSLAP
jgi:hypothetical protein